ENTGAALNHVVVVTVKQRLPHPNADKLSLCTVNDGQRDYQIVCGAPNVAEGLNVPLAKEGAELPGGFKIKRSKIRGVESEGMLCSAEELGLPKGVDGLLVLDPSLAPGLPLAQALGLDDPVLTLETTANRPDHLSLRGLAREVSALGGLALKDRTSDFAMPGPSSAADPGFAVHTDSQACSYYSVRRVQGVRVGPSPDWLRHALEKSGIRSISNVVDATNCVLLEYGQPMHAFDASRISGGRLEARLARPGERIQTLDGQERVLEAEDVVIADAAGAQALGGIMGGKLTEVTDSTTDLVLEAAVFAPKRIRRTARRLGLVSESGHRFERGVDALAVDEAMDRCVALILEIAGGKALGGRLSAGDKGGAPDAVALRPKEVNALLGTRIADDEMVRLLQRRFFKVEASAETDPAGKAASPGQNWRVSPPSWRRDVQGWADLAEEVLQMAG
ncbi:MAG TPA: phenylalanine--tRNA ligase subunit beta, partial [bacterium]|nr:phenylalanine--tRNA ligase subunit beta [bacterium]